MLVKLVRTVRIQESSQSRENKLGAEGQEMLFAKTNFDDVEFELYFQLMTN